MSFHDWTEDSVLTVTLSHGCSQTVSDSIHLFKRFLPLLFSNHFNEFRYSWKNRLRSCSGGSAGAVAEYNGASLCLVAEPEVSVLCLRGLKLQAAVRRKRVGLESFVLMWYVMNECSDYWTSVSNVALLVSSAETCLIGTLIYASYFLCVFSPCNFIFILVIFFLPCWEQDPI